MMGNIASLNIKLPEEVKTQTKTFFTAYNKKPQQQPVFLHKTHFEGDGVGDTKHHGGADKAVCVYPFEHYEKWTTELNLEAPLSVPAFGENLTVKGLLEDDVCIGDVFSVGKAIVQITQPRQPCQTLASILCRPDMIKKVVDTGRTGYYLRVLKEGLVAEGDEMLLIEKHPAHISVTESNRIKYGFLKDAEKIQRLIEVKELAESMRESLQKRKM
ncbi:MOSC domain-containing protein [Fictibacillus sp. 7GRE50]|uniref:MOSC domain-containing protein n=1 Tax=Fictibacillus sp. 7GRE50 TaxID=2745878 RepID=UPI0018CE0CBA|nr:MOSC domain-containing protein [Fictibacillus sp. 7GRE50]MBH0164433.1 MOSC domain-containing protein [Fictibacillus sp. 7GRE50]